MAAPTAPNYSIRAWLRRRSLASRVTWLTTVAVGLSVTIVSLASYLLVRSQSMHEIDVSLHNRASQAARTDTLENLSQQQFPPYLLGAADVSVIFLTVTPTGGRVRSANAAAAAQVGLTEMAVAQRSDTWSARTVKIDGDHYRMVAVTAGKNEALILAQSIEPTDKMLDRLGFVMLFFGLSGMFAAGASGWGVARNGLRPVRALTNEVERIARTEDLTPIPVEGTDEIARLSAAFNQLLAAVSASRERQRQLVADAGHELRTPLTSLRTNLDLLVQAEAGDSLPPDARRELMADVRSQIEEMTTLVGDLVELARDVPVSANVETLDLAEVVRQALGRVRRRAPQLHFDVETDPWWVVGEYPSLERAFTNLFDNAAKWSPEGGKVTITLHAGTLVVCDEGCGISEADRPHIFDRFYRSTDSRGMPGSGLGLSIVKAVIDRHGGSIEVGEAPSGGAKFSISIPGSTTPGPSDH